MRQLFHLYIELAISLSSGSSAMIFQVSCFNTPECVHSAEQLQVYSYTCNFHSTSTLLADMAAVLHSFCSLWQKIVHTYTDLVHIATTIGSDLSYFSHITH